MQAAFTRTNLHPRPVYGTRPVPRARRGEVLVEVYASSMNPIDWKFPAMVRAYWPGPMTLGRDVVGRVVEVGAGVAEWSVGDAVFGTKVWSYRGSFAEYVAIAADHVARPPGRLSIDEVAALPLAGLTALQGLRHLGLTSGKQLVVVGASGGVGHLVVQLASAAGIEVIAVCSGRNAEFVRSLGAFSVIDYTTTGIVDSLAGAGIDGVFDTTGAQSLRSCAPFLSADARLVTTVVENRQVGIEIARSMLRRGGQRQTARWIALRCDRADLDELARLADAGTVHPHVETEFPLADIADAIAANRAGRTRGKLVIRVAPEEGDAGPTGGHLP